MCLVSTKYKNSQQLSLKNKLLQGKSINHTSTGPILSVHQNEKNYTKMYTREHCNRPYVQPTAWGKDMSYWPAYVLSHAAPSSHMCRSCMAHIVVNACSPQLEHRSILSPMAQLESAKKTSCVVQLSIVKVNLIRVHPTWVGMGSQPYYADLAWSTTFRGRSCEIEMFMSLIKFEQESDSRNLPY